MKKTMLALSLFTLTNPASAGPGHDHGESAFASGGAAVTEFELNDKQMKNLDIQFEAVQRLPIKDTVEALMFTELLPEKRMIISPRFGGKVLNIAVKVGQKVKKGQELATLEPVSVGNSRVVLRAPINGFVVNLHAGVGGIIDAGGQIMEIGDPSQMLLRGVLYETPDITKIEIGQSVHAHLDIMPEREFIGKVQRINRVIDQSSRTFSVYALVDTPNGDVLPGLQGRMEIAAGHDEPVLAVPKRAVLGEAGAFFVYVIDGFHVERRDVVIGEKSGQHVEIREGVKHGENVVTLGNYQLQYISVGGVHTHDHGHDHGDEHEHEQNNEHGHQHDDKHSGHDDHSHETEKAPHKDHDHGHHKGHDHHGHHSDDNE